MSASRALVLTIYRGLMRSTRFEAFGLTNVNRSIWPPEAQQLRRPPPPTSLTLQTPLRPRAEWGQGGYFDLAENARKIKSEMGLVGEGDGDEVCVYTREELRGVIRAAFRRNANLVEGDGEGMDRAIEAGFGALRFLGHQLLLHCSSSDTTTKGVRVLATSTACGVAVPRGDGPHQRDAQFVFAYRIRVENQSAHTVKLTGRGWQIVDATLRKIEVPKGSPGVVGFTPELMPGQAFQYMSGTELPTPVGTISGTFQMETDDPSVASGRFDAVVGPFALIAHPSPSPPEE